MTHEQEIFCDWVLRDAQDRDNLGMQYPHRHGCLHNRLRRHEHKHTEAAMPVEICKTCQKKRAGLLRPWIKRS